MLNVDKVRNHIQSNAEKYIKGGESQVKNISIATAKVTTKGGVTENLLSVSGKSWKGTAPKEVTIDGIKYKVIVNDSQSVNTYTGVNSSGNSSWNYNHAEKKLASYIQDNYSGRGAKVEIGVQNTSADFPGMCVNCKSSMFDFGKNNPDINITIYEGTTGINP